MTKQSSLPGSLQGCSVVPLGRLYGCFYHMSSEASAAFVLKEFRNLSTPQGCDPFYLLPSALNLGFIYPHYALFWLLSQLIVEEGLFPVLFSYMRTQNHITGGVYLLFLVNSYFFVQAMSGLVY